MLYSCDLFLNFINFASRFGITLNCDASSILCSFSIKVFAPSGTLTLTCISYKVILWPILPTIFFTTIQISMKMSFCSYLNSAIAIVTKFCTCHDSTTVVACAKFGCDILAINGITAKLIFHKIWIVMENIIREMLPRHMLFMAMCSSA